MNNRSRLLFFVLMLMMLGSSKAQSNDSALIRQTALNYVEGFFAADANRIEKAVAPELAKRIIIHDPSGDAIQDMGATLLMLSARKNKNLNVLNPNDPFKADVYIYDISDNMATVKIVTNKFRFIDYAHLGKFNGEWRVVNVLWQFISH